MVYVRHIPKEVSWLSFNERVLQEANDPNVPLIERMKFLGIFSSNLDEFFRVRVATINRLAKMGKSGKKIFHYDPATVLEEIQRIYMHRRDQFDNVYQTILQELEEHHIHIIDEKGLNEKQKEFVEDYFLDKVRPVLIPIMFTRLKQFPSLIDKTIYLVISLGYKTEKSRDYALIEVPTDHLSRFVLLPSESHHQYIMLLDDVIRYSLPHIFHMLDYTEFKAYTIKLTRDSELAIEDDLSETYIRKVSKSVKRRASGNPVRFVYDASMPEDMLHTLTKKLNISKEDTPIAGGRYHNFKDFINFPKIGPKKIHRQKRSPISHKDLPTNESLWQIIRSKDILLHYPYHSFNHFLDLLREAAIDPHVESIKITLYRVAKDSKVINALINAVRNGKQVVVVIELQARFDEAANIYWADYLREVGVRVIFGVPDLKVHGKLCLISRKERNKLVNYVTIGTGNFNEDTASLYTDHFLITFDKKLTREVSRIFEFFEHNYKIYRYNHLILSPFALRRKFYKMIDNEIANAKEGKEAHLKVKVNNLADDEFEEKLYEASQAGVKIKLIVRSMFSLIPMVPNMSENIEAISIVDKYLEHTRIIIFANGGEPKVFIASSDWMTRNIDRRVEVTCPIYDSSIKQELIDYFDIQWKDNVKARVWDKYLKNEYRDTGHKSRFRAQDKIYDYIKQIHENQD